MSNSKIIKQKITDALKENYMPYAMSVIISRAIPEIDGFKPAHRKLLYTMYDMGLMRNGAKYVKCANIVGAGMKLNPHGDASIYDTMVRMTVSNETLLFPLVDSKGSFGNFSKIFFGLTGVFSRIVCITYRLIIDQIHICGVKFGGFVEPSARRSPVLLHKPAQSQIPVSRQFITPILQTFLECLV